MSTIAVTFTLSISTSSSSVAPIAAVDPLPTTVLTRASLLSSNCCSWIEATSGGQNFLKLVIR